MTQEPVQQNEENMETQTLSFAEPKLFVVITADMKSVIIWNPEVHEILTGIVATNGPILIQMPWDSVDLTINSLDSEEVEQLMQKIMQAEDYNPESTAKLLR
jgi:hypothetical protein